MVSLFFKTILLIYLFSAVCVSVAAGVFSSCDEWELHSSYTVHGLLIPVASLVTEHRL